MFKTYSSSSSLVITSRWCATSRLAVPASVRLVYWTRTLFVFQRAYITIRAKTDDVRIWAEKHLITFAGAPPAGQDLIIAIQVRIDDPDSKVHRANTRPTGPMWAPCCPHELNYLGMYWIASRVVWRECQCDHNIIQSNFHSNCFKRRGWK